MNGQPSILADGRGRILLFCWLGWVFDFCDLILFSFTKAQVAAELDLPLYGAIAWIEGWSLLATAVGGIAVGRLADRIGRRTALVCSILFFSIGALATAAATGFWTLLLARLLTGLGVGGEWGVGHALVAEHWPEAQRDRVHGLLQAGSPVAMALAAVLGCFVAPVLGWRLVFVLAALPALLAALARWALPGPESPAVSRAGGNGWSLLRPPYRRTTMVLLAVLVLHMAGFWSVYAELPAALVRQHGVTLHEVGWFQLQVNAVHVLADIGFGVLALRVGRIRLFVLCCALFAVGQLWLAMRLDAVAGDFRSFTFAVALLGLGAGTWSCFGALFGRHYPPELRATAAAGCYASARSVQLLLKPLLGTWFVTAGSFAPALWIGAGCAAGAALLILLLPPAVRQGEAD